MPLFLDNNFTLANATDQTKMQTFNLVNRTTGTLGIVFVPDHDGTIVLSSNTNGGADRQFLFATGVGLPAQWRDPVLEDDVFRISKATDSTAKLIFSCTNISNNTSRTWTVADADIIVAGSAAALTSGRVALVTTGGLLADDPDLTFSGATLTATGLVIGTTGLTSYLGVATVATGIPSLVAQANLTAQSAAIAATTIYAVPAAGVGMYRISWVATVTTAATTSSVLGGTNGFQLTYTDNDDSVVKTSGPTAVSNFTSAGNTTATQVSGVFCANCKASTNLQYAFDYTSVGATAMQYNLHVRVERI